MANEQIQGPVGIVGRGLTVKANDVYVPGEFDVMTNVEVTQSGTVGSRKAFNFCPQHDDVDNIQQGFRKFIGNYGPWPVFTTYDSAAGEYGDVFVIYNNPDQGYYNSVVRQNFDFAALAGMFLGGPGLPGVTLAFQMEGFWHYNQANYYLVVMFYNKVLDVVPPGEDGVLRGHRYMVFKQDKDFDLENPQPLEFDLADMSYVNVWFEQVDTSTDPHPSFNKFNSWSHHPVLGHTLWRERAWFATHDTVYASKATDPFIWAAPDGFFAKFPQQEIKDIYALGDILYIFMDSSIHALQYDTDPNVDGSITTISKELGAESVTAVGDTIYFIKDDGLYTVSGMNVTKAFDLHLGIESQDTTADVAYSLALGSFDNALYFFPRFITHVDIPVLGWRGAFSQYESLGRISIYKFDLTTQAFSSINVKNTIEASEALIGGYATDLLAVSSESWNNQNALYFSFTAEYGETEGNIFGFLDINEIFNDHAIVGPLGTMGYVSPSMRLGVKQFTPDMMPYFMKKYRSLLLSGNFEEIEDEPVRLLLSMGSVALAEQELKDRGTSTALQGYRYPINQRAKTMDITFARTAVVTDEQVTRRTFDLQDARVLWTYTAKAPHDNVADTS